ncbi:hypothetical protein DL770_011961 [Monosporascus sp. CRB-9-2]|nr:hypothetical protein DL770_011961 [Monosporascus sp. CRB-9-2]
MHFTTLMPILAAAAPFVLAAPGKAPASAPSTTSLEGSIMAGPLSYEELQSQVKKMKADGSLYKRDGICAGVYYCSDADFLGDCYYGCYPISTSTYPGEWASRISSFGPDRGFQCYTYDHDCSDGDGSTQAFSFPGGTLNPDMNDQLFCFYCNPSS